MSLSENIYVTRSVLPELDEYIDEIRDIWDSRIVTNMGEKHKRLQENLEEYLNVDHIELFTNGHMAIELSIQALKLSGEIITTPYTFASTTHAIVRNNCTPVFCDIEPETFTIDTNKIEKLINDNTVAILPVHVYGNICNIEEIDRIAKKYNLKVIYDAAHSFGEKYKGVTVGNFGDVSCFSFHATKVFNSIEGGAASFKDFEIGKSLYQLKNFGIKDEVVVDGVGSNAKMNEFCAAMGLCNLRYIDDNINERKILVDRYIVNLQKIDGVKLNDFSEDVEYNYSYFPVVIDKDEFGVDRNYVVKALAEENIYARKYFYPTTNSFDCYKDFFNPKETPIALGISKKVITLPLWPTLGIDNVDKISQIIHDCKKGF